MRYVATEYICITVIFAGILLLCCETEDMGDFLMIKLAGFALAFAGYKGMQLKRYLNKIFTIKSYKRHGKGK